MSQENTGNTQDTQGTNDAIATTGAVDGINVEQRPHEAMYHYKSFPEDKSNKGYNNLMELVSAGKLAEEDINRDKRDDGTPVVKRKSQAVVMEVPVVESFISEDAGFTPKMKQHLQELINKYIEDSQREDVDNATGNLRHWSVIFNDDFSKRRASTKVTKEQVEEAAKVLAEVLEALGTKEKAREYMVDLAQRKFGAAACKTAKPEVLERIQTLVLESYQQLEGEPEQVQHSAVFNLWLDNLKKALEPADDDIDVDLFETE
jgi:predicted house-cleaning noncanonical NTP pyrophosphatase (MazG superfamily)